MAKGDKIGEFEQLVLLAIYGLGKAASGMNVLRDLEEQGNREIQTGAVYAALDRLLAKDYISVSESRVRLAEGGRASFIYRLETEGKRALRQSLGLITNAADGLVTYQRNPRTNRIRVSMVARSKASSRAHSITELKPKSHAR